jgi:raffinose/stachyose/melibiose transport system substrate-binding protein
VNDRTGIDAGRQDMRKERSTMEQQQDHGMNRRGFLAGAGLTALGLALPASLAACSSGGGAGTTTTAGTQGSSGSAATNSTGAAGSMTASGSGNATGSASGGASGGASTGASSSVPQASGTVQLWMDIQGQANQKYFDTNVVGAFHAANPNVTVKVTYYKGQDLRNQIQTALQAKSGPDIVRGPAATQTIAWSNAGVLADLTGYASAYGWAEKLDPWAYQAFSQNGRIFALPLRVDTMMLYYNKTLFDSKGWATPKSQDDLEALATEIAGQKITPFGTSNVDWKAASEWLMSIFWNVKSGPDAVYQALSGQIKFSDPVFVDAAALLQSYFQKGWMAGGTDNYFAVPSQEIGAKFGKGQIAMIPQGEWFMSQVGTYFGKAGNNANDWDWVAFPSLNKDVPYPTYPVGIGGSFAINQASGNKDAAAAFLNWYFTDRPSALKRMSEVPATYNVPIPVAKGDLPASTDPRSAREITEVNAAIDAGNYGYVTWTWWPPKSDVWVYQGFDQVLTGKITPQKYCQQLADTFDQEKAAGTIPTIIKRAG